MIKGLKLSNQAQLVLLINVAQIVFFQFISAFLPISFGDKLIMFVLILISMGIATFYMTYSINCMVVGQCNMWAWLIAGIAIVSVVFGMLGTTMSLKKYGQLYAMSSDKYLSTIASVSGVTPPPIREDFEEEDGEYPDYPEDDGEYGEDDGEYAEDDGDDGM
jgi:hypothetical protein